MVFSAVDVHSTDSGLRRYVRVRLNLSSFFPSSSSSFSSSSGAHTHYGNLSKSLWVDFPQKKTTTTTTKLLLVTVETNGWINLFNIRVAKTKAKTKIKRNMWNDTNQKLVWNKIMSRLYTVHRRSQRHYTNALKYWATCDSTRLLWLFSQICIRFTLALRYLHGYYCCCCYRFWLFRRICRRWTCSSCFWYINLVFR